MNNWFPPGALTPAPVPKTVQSLLDWVPLKKYLELYGENKAAVESRIRRKQWQAGVQFSRPAGSGLWVSIKAVNAWAAAHVPDSSEGEP